MSNFFTWDAAKYAINVPNMDHDHQVLLDYMGRLHDLYTSQASRTEQAAAVEALVKFTVQHFEREEAHMARIGYPGLKTHSLIHKNLLKRVAGYADAFSAGGDLSDDFFSFLKTWLTSHILGVDTKYASHTAAA